jgi:ankyrin repeat protein
MNILSEYCHNKIDADILMKNIKSNILDERDKDWLLNKASYKGHIQIVKYLLETYKNTDINNFIIRASEGGHMQTVKYLLETYKNININNLDMYGYSSLHFASKSNYEITKILLEYGAHVNIIGHNNFTPLYFAINGKNLEIIKLLIENGANVNILVIDNISPLHISININRKDITEILINNGANINTIDIDHKTPLYYACSKKNNYSYIQDIIYDFSIRNDIEKYQIETVEYLLQSGADPSIPDKNGNTVLHIASSKNNHKYVELLLQYGADTTVINDKGIKAIDMTKDNEIIHMIQYHAPVILK